MALLSLYTANTVRPGTITNQQLGSVAGEAITAGAPVMLDPTTGKAYNSDANDADKDDPQPQQSAAPAKPAPKKPAGRFDDMEDDIPF